MNSTISLELCSDDFEEHVLPYLEEDWGLYCHGLIKNVEHFETYEPDFVQEFSRKIGFHEVPFVKRDNIREVKEFCETREGKPIEGWVIRSWNMFVKYKYEKPYLVWREWREITKSCLKNGVLHNYNWRYQETKQYSEWVKKEMMTNIKVFDGFLKNHGIIKRRDMYLKNTKTQVQEVEEVVDKILIIPVGVPGVGKSTIYRMLSELLAAATVENDSLNRKVQKFTKCVIESLMFNSIVIADRNNHLIGQRKDLVLSCKSRFPHIKIIVIEWVIPSEKDLHWFKEFLYERVEERGENHKTLTPKNIKYKEIIDEFLEKRMDLDYDLKYYDTSNISFIQLQTDNSIDHNIRHICKEIRLPLENQILESIIENSLQYKIDGPEPSYWGLSVCKEQLKIIVDLIVENIDCTISEMMVKKPKENHVTLAYSRRDLCNYWKS